MKFAVRFAVALMLVLVVIVGLGTTAVSASNALPGDPLYLLKTSAQNARLMLTWDQDSRRALEHHFQEEYRNDVRELMHDGRQVTVRFLGTLDALDQNVWVIGGLPVSVNQATVISGNIELGDVVSVEAAVQKDGSILASQLALHEDSIHHPNGFTQMTPEHNLMHTAEPEEHNGDPKHQSPSTLHPTQERNHHITPTLVPSATAAPAYHPDESPCQTCDNSSSSQDTDHHDDDNGDDHDEHDDHH